MKMMLRKICISDFRFSAFENNYNISRKSDFDIIRLFNVSYISNLVKSLRETIPGRKVGGRGMER